LTTSTTTAFNALFVGSDEILGGRAEKGEGCEFNDPLAPTILGGRAEKEGCEFNALLLFVFIVLRCWVPNAEQRVALESNNVNVIVKGDGLLILGSLGRRPLAAGLEKKRY
jgi:hypothetical protein